MTNHFHRNLNRMALFTALLLAGLLIFHKQFLQIAITNIVLNGIIIGTTIFGIILCFIEMFKLLPEYKWLRNYVSGKQKSYLPPRLLKPVAIMLTKTPRQISSNTFQNLLDTVLVRFEDSRETIKYITNTLIFLGLLGTFWGLVMTVGGFAELINGLNFEDESVLLTMQEGLVRPLSGMATAFTSSLMGLVGSLSVGFLGLQIQLAQNAIFRELEDVLSTRTNILDFDTVIDVKKKADDINKKITKIEEALSNTDY